MQGPRGAGCRRRCRMGAATCGSSSARAQMLGRCLCGRCYGLCWAQGTVSSLDKAFFGTSCLVSHLAAIAVTFGLQKAAKKQDYPICGLEDIGSMHSVLEAAGQSTRDVQSHLLTSSLSRAGHSGGRGWMQRGSKQQAGKVHHRKGPPRMMQPTCWEKACGSATQSCGTLTAD